MDAAGLYAAWHGQLFVWCLFTDLTVFENVAFRCATNLSDALVRDIVS